MPLVGDGASWVEALKGLTCGIVFGATSPLAGQPFDTVKTKMQAQVRYASGSATQVFSDVVAREGVRGLYKGLVPPLLGSMVYRSVQFSSYAAAYSYLGRDGNGRYEIPGTGGLQARVVAGGVFSSTCRSLIETPLELLKVRRQVGLPWLPEGQAVLSVSTVRWLYTGFVLTWLRTVGALGGFFILVDSVDRHLPQLGQIPAVGPFLKGSICATTAWWLAWPFEVLKSQVQAADSAQAGTTSAGQAGHGKDRHNMGTTATAGAGSTATASGSGPGRPAALSTASRFRSLVAERGLVGLYRGIGPGTARSLVANGAALAAFTACQDAVRAIETASAGR